MTARPSAARLRSASSNANRLLAGGRMLLKQDRGPEAVPLLELSLSGARDPEAVKPFLALALDASGERHRARLLWLDVARRSDATGLQRHKVLRRLGRAAMNAGRLEEAVSLFRRHLELVPRDADASDRLLQVSLALCQAEHKLNLYDQHVRRYGETSATLIALATLVHHPWSPEAAAAALKRAETLAGSSHLDAAQLARAYEKIGRPGRALELLQLPAYRESTSRQIVKMQVKLLQATGAEKSAVVAPIERLITAEPGVAGHRAMLGRWLSAFGDWANAAAAYEQAIALDPDIAAHWTGAIVAMGNLERDEVIDDLVMRANVWFRKNGTAGQLDLATIELAAERFEEAAIAAERALGNAATARPARERLVEARMSSGAYLRSWSHLAAALDEGRASPFIKRMAARCATALRLAPTTEQNQVSVFPDALFTRALLNPPSRPILPASDTVMLVTSSLAAGGAERQVALTSAGISLARRGTARTVLVGLDLTRERGRAVMRSLAETDRLVIDDLARIDDNALFRTMMASDPSVTESLRLIAAFPRTLSRDILKLYDCFRRHRPSLVHLWQDGVISTGSVAAVLAGVPKIVCSMRNVVATEGDRRRYRSYLATMYRGLAARSDVVFTANSAAGAHDYEKWLGMPHGTIKVLRNGVDVASVRARTSIEARRSVRERLNLPADALLVGGVFRLAPAKRPLLWLDVVARAAAADSRVRGVVVGDGAMRDEIQRAIDARGLSGRITLAGRQNPVEPWISAMDVLLLASEVEGLPNVLLEAESLGVPVVTTDAGGSSEAVLHGLIGMLVQDDSAENLAAAVTRIIKSDAIRHRARVGAPAFVEQRFGLTRMLTETVATYGTTDPQHITRVP